MPNKVYSTPRISINQLASYLTASAGQRRTIVRNAKQPKTFMVNWYEFAMDAIVPFIAGSCSDVSIIENQIGTIQGMTPASTYEESRYQTNIEALEAIHDCYEQLPLDAFTVTRGLESPPRLSIANVEISVRPEFMLSGTYRQQAVVGAMKIYLSKDAPLNEASGPYISAVVQRFVDKQSVGNDATVRGQACMVLDVFARQVHHAPNAITRRFQDIEAACNEIAALWPTL